MSARRVSSTVTAGSATATESTGFLPRCSCAWMWRGDLHRAVLVYPLGPLVFVASWVGLAYLAYAVVAHRRLTIEAPKKLTQTLLAVLLIAMAANWMSKWLWLGV